MLVISYLFAAYFNHVPRCKQKQGSVWDGGFKYTYSDTDCLPK